MYVYEVVNTCGGRYHQKLEHVIEADAEESCGFPNVGAGKQA